MIRLMLTLCALLPSLGVVLRATAQDAPRDELAAPTTWTAPSVDAVRRQTLAWLEAQKTEPAKKQQVEALWTKAPKDATAAQLLDLVAESIGLVDTRAGELIDTCSAAQKPGPIKKFGWLRDEKTPPFVAANLRLLYGRWLAQNRLYDEVLQHVAELKTEQVVDPASLLFYQATANHWLLKMDEATTALAQLLQRPERLPRRYASLGRLMQADLATVKEDNLDHIGRRIKDIRRRLDLGRADKKVIEVQDGVIESLDKLIKKIEDQQQQQQQAAGGDAGPSSPAEESRPLAGKGTGRVVKRRLEGAGKSWGDLPAKERARAMQQIGRAYPAHYRDIIEDFFRRLAKEKADDEKPRP
ncbi:MAG: hypothetical protein IIA67_08275 [Planctomycetes bacterium]|nr:hypothetical protein [Planctomycetota bacterium]